MRLKPQRLAYLLSVLAVATAARADDIDDLVRIAMGQRHIPAVSIAVVKDGALIRTGAYGIADLENDIPARPNTVFKIGSVSKQFISAGIMILVQDRQMGLDDKISKYIEGSPDTWKDITVRHVLTHTSGLVREGPGFDAHRIQPDIEVIQSAFALALLWNPGDKYSYSNLGYYVLAEIIHKVSGKAWEAFLKERVFDPLGMTSTRPTSVTEIVLNRARGYVWNADKFANAEDWIARRPSGAFLSTAQDMAKWEVALQTDRILTPASKEAMWTPVRLNDGKTYPYGFAWELDDFPPGGYTTGVPMVRHEGTIAGFRAAFGKLPRHGIGIIVLSNLDRAALDSIVAGIAVHYVPELLPAARNRWPDMK